MINLREQPTWRERMAAFLKAKVPFIWVYISSSSNSKCALGARLSRAYKSCYHGDLAPALSCAVNMSRLVAAVAVLD